METTSDKIVSQKVRWGVNDGKEPGISITETGEFIDWDDLKPEIETRLLNQVSKIPVGSTVELGELNGRTNWIVKVLDSNGTDIAHVWFGGNANKDWEWDGVVRVGNPKAEMGDPIVWQGFVRYSDGSYRRIENFI